MNEMRKLIRIKRPSYLKLKDGMSTINVFETTGVQTVTTHQIKFPQISQLT
jgi:hypothetical protein